MLRARAARMSNKVASAVQLRFDMAKSPSLPDDVKQRLAVLAGQRLTKEGVIVITAQNHRLQEAQPPRMRWPGWWT